MKVLFVTRLWPTKKHPQYVIFLKQLAAALKDNGIEIHIAVIDNNTKNEYIADEFKLVVINKNDYKEDLERLLNEEIYDVIEIHASKDFRIIKCLKKSCKKNCSCLVKHLHGLNIFKEYRNIYELYGIYMFFKKKIILKMCDAVVCVSDKVCDIYKKGMKLQNAYTVYNGVDFKKFFPLQDKSVNGRIELICIANLIEIKGQDYLIKALKILVEDGYDNLHLSLYGRGVEEDNLKSLVKELDLDRYVDFMGYVEYDIIAEQLRKADIFIMPSYFEALGCVYLEAMASKVCTVGCENQGIAEIIEHGKNGLLVKEQDEKSIYENLKMLIDNPDKRKALAQAGYETVVPEFSWDNIGKQLKGVYDKIISEKRKDKIR